VNLNTATRAQLAAVDGIGWYRAGVVVAHREQFGPYLAVADLLLTGVFVPSEVTALASLVTVG
jgi:DNA uptake protein ComE-like DNA-binding protein